MCTGLRVAGEFRGAVLGVGLIVEIGGGGIEEPLQTVVGAARRDQRVGVGVEQARGGRAGARRVQIGGLQCHDGLVELPQIHSRTGDHDPQLGGLVTGERLRLVTAAELDGPFRPAQTALAVRHHRQQPGTSGHPARRTQLGERFRPFLGVIGHHARGLPDHGDPARALPRGPRVGQREAGIVLEQLDGHYHVPGDGLGVVLVQAEQIAAHRGIEIGGLHVFRQIRLVRTRGAPVRRPSARGPGTLAATTPVVTIVAATGAVAGIATTIRAVRRVVAVTGLGGGRLGPSVDARVGPLVGGLGPLDGFGAIVVVRGLRPIAVRHVRGAIFGRRGVVELLNGRGALVAHRRIDVGRIALCGIGVRGRRHDAEDVALTLAPLLAVRAVQRCAVLADVALPTGIATTLESTASAIVVTAGTASVVVTPLVSTAIGALATAEATTIRGTTRTIVTVVAAETTALVAPEPATVGAAPRAIIAFVAPEATTVRAAPRAVVALVAAEATAIEAAPRTVVTLVATEATTIGGATRTVVVTAPEAAPVTGAATARVVATLVATTVTAVAAPEPAAIAATARTVVAFVPAEAGATTGTVVVVATEAAAIAAVVAAAGAVVALVAPEPATIAATVRAATGTVVVIAPVSAAITAAVETTCGTVGFITATEATTIAGAAATGVVTTLVPATVAVATPETATVVVVATRVATTARVVTTLVTAPIATTTGAVVVAAPEAAPVTRAAATGVVATLVTTTVTAVAAPETATVTATIVAVEAATLALGTASATTIVVVAAESAAFATVVTVSATGAIGRFAAPAEAAGVTVPAERLPSVVVFRHGDPFLDSPTSGSVVVAPPTRIQPRAEDGASSARRAGAVTAHKRR